MQEVPGGGASSGTPLGVAFNAGEFPHPKAQTAQKNEGQRAWLQRHRPTGYLHLRAYHQPHHLCESHQTEHATCHSQSRNL